MYTFTYQFISNQGNVEFLKATMMGPNAMRISEELASCLDIRDSMRILDLGCGYGLSSLLLSRKYGSTVFAADLWISPTENYKNFQILGIDDKTIPLFVDATKTLPFANGYFDIIFSIDSYHYFGHSPEMLPSLISYVKKGGCIAVAVPGLQREFENGTPDELKPFLPDNANFYTLNWWKDLCGKVEGIEITDCGKMACCKQTWDEWLTSSNPYAVREREMIKVENGNYFNIIQLIAKII